MITLGSSTGNVGPMGPQGEQGIQGEPCILPEELESLLARVSYLESHLDFDGDGSPLSEDCDDDNPYNYPGAEEVCDGMDNDCDGEIDEGFVLQTWYKDADADSYGDPEDSYTGCPSQGFVNNADDCDDENQYVNPGADEICDGVDNNCDGQIDECSGAGCEAVAHAEVSCVNGECLIISCAVSWYDTNQEYQDGCECQDDYYEPNNGFDQAVDLGVFVDTNNDLVIVNGNIPSESDSDFFTFFAEDSIDAGGTDSFWVSFRLLNLVDFLRYNLFIMNTDTSEIFCVDYQTCVDYPELQLYTFSEDLYVNFSNDSFDIVANQINTSDNSAMFIVEIYPDYWSSFIPGCLDYQFEIANGYYYVWQ